MRRLMWVPPLMAIFAARAAHAYSYEEHCRVSHLGLRLAAKRIAAMEMTRTPSFRRPLPDWLSVLTAHRCGRAARSYGDLVARVDYALSPTDFYAGAASATGFGELFTDRIPWERIDSLASSTQQNWKAARQNADHFQDRALVAGWKWHAAAVRAGSLSEALVLNAFADHFNQDITAPGHLRSPRRDLHDAAALSIHDYYNRIGQRYYFGDLTPLAAFLADDEDLGALVAKVGWSADSAPARLAALEDSGVVFFGDGRLTGQPLQELYLALVTAQSTFDVLLSYVTETPTNSFTAPQWQPYTIDRANRRLGRQSPLAVTQFGQYRQVVERGPLPFGTMLALTLTNGWVKSDGVTKARLRAQLEMLVLGSPGGSWLADKAVQALQSNATWGVLVGAEANVGTRDDHGFFGRLVLPSRKLDLQLSLLAGGRKEYRPGDDRWYFVPGVRGETGIGLFFIGVGTEIDQLRLADGSTRKGVVVKSSVTLGIPSGKLGL